ncbi:MAG: lipopolysaccharide transport periplasmic protein LptA, partial [Marinobacter sp.]|nr:lipopolysaccharide transport periplasmic protein LptA [Marinobacter sp.]
MRPFNRHLPTALAALLTLVLSGPALAFDLDSDQPITVSADSARLDDSKGVATYT